ncbi:DNA primase [Phaeovulum sp. W22_SRMD_FR3]|uniref:DNA primase n=1 Tax=Phaeovulum sp. W22_SRMD_FR3 TaxID=3240274 RepID=UPI003F9756CE
MSLPPGFLDELRNRVSISQVVGRKVLWDPRKSNQGKGDMWAPCPFHQEKSASFHVDDRNGYYYCFGCHAKGDALKFIQETENVGFMEAVEILAREAGMPMPARDPQAAQKADRRSELAAVMEEAVRWFRLQLQTGAGQAARDYLAGRKLGQAAQDRFELGYSPDNRQALFHALTGKGIAPDLIVDAGLCARPEGGGEPYDRFRGRIIYPIRDARGRCISLGGRAMDPNARAKYLNGPETELFDKGRSLYNHGPAREACGKGQPLIVCEGYMDVIALVEAGFGGAVAPLGTAVTEDQLRMMWRVHPEPVIALDGDTAGTRAALRVIDLALPLLEAGQGLRFAVLPAGQDPDDLLKSGGAAAMTKVIEGARPMVDLLWQRETEGKVFDSPERKAGLDKSLRAAIKRIADPSIRSHYGDEIKRLREALFGTAPRGGDGFRSDGFRTEGFRSEGFRGEGFGKSGGKAPRAANTTGAARKPQGKPWQQVQVLPQASTRLSALAGSEEGVTEYLGEAMVLAIFVAQPALVMTFESQLETLHLTHRDHQDLRQLLLRLAHQPGRLNREEIEEAAPEEVETLMSLPHVRIAPAVRLAEDPETGRLGLAEAMAKLDAYRIARSEIEHAMRDMEALVDEGVTWRLSQAARAIERAHKGPEAESRQSVKASNGLELDKEELDLSRELFSKIDFSRGGKPRK